MLLNQTTAGVLFGLFLAAGLVACHPPGLARLQPAPGPTAAVTAVPAGDAALPGSEWLLASLRGQDPLANTRITLEFTGAPGAPLAEFQGYAGCNHYGGAWAVTGEGRLQPAEIEVTTELCPGAAGVQEQAYIEALARAAAYRLAGDRLELQDEAGQAVLVYTRQPEYAMDPATLAGTAWQLTAAEGCTPGDGPPATLAFLDGRWLTWRAGCQGYIAAYRAAGDDLGLTFIAALPPDCPEDLSASPESSAPNPEAPPPGPEGEPSPGPDTDCGADLEGVANVHLAENQLELILEDGQTLHYEPLPAGAGPSLEGPTWSLLASIEAHRPEGETAIFPMPGEVISGTQLTLTLDGSTASGSAGCNPFHAAYGRDRSQLPFGPVAASKKACLIPEGVMAQERRYLALLAATVGYRIVGNQLWLYTAGGPALVYREETAGALPSPVPASIRAQADQVVIARVGQAFFDEHYAFDPLASSTNDADPGCVQDPDNCAPFLVRPHYRVGYVVSIPGQPGLQAGAGLILDADGSLVAPEEMAGIPDCDRTPQECLFPVDRAAALAIARAAGLETGLGEWQTHFHWWSGEPATFVWTVDTTLTSDAATGQATGRTAVIDANSGAILEISDWQRVP